MSATLIREKSRVSYWVIPCLLSIVICLAAQVRFFLPFSPVPITLQVHLILLFSYLLGDRRALLMTSLFLLQGCLGFSVFATGAGVARLLGPTGGYLIGYLVASYVTGLLNQKSPLLAMGIGNTVVYLFGWLHLTQFVGALRAIEVGVAPFLLLDVLKLVLCCWVTCAKRYVWTDSSKEFYF
tara:strand:- start:847 stop:1392 length:546 start_codon:yes stop_codon:yes gene_type:complete